MMLTAIDCRKAGVAPLSIFSCIGFVLVRSAAAHSHVVMSFVLHALSSVFKLDMTSGVMQLLAFVTELSVSSGRQVREYLQYCC